MAITIMITDRIMKAATAAAMLILFFTCGSASAQSVRGEKSFGPRAGYVSRNNSAFAGLEFEYSFSEHLRLAPSADIIFRNEKKDGLAVNLDVHFPFAFAGGRAGVYPLAGVNYTSWGLHSDGADNGKDVTSHANRFGANAGCGIELRCSPTLKLSVEARYSLMKRYSTAFAGVGIAYVF